MGLLDIANKLRTTVAASKIDKATKEKNIAANKKIKEQQNAPLFEYAATKKSFKDPIESISNPSSDYFTPTKFENKSSSFAESELSKITKVNPATAGMKGISQENSEYIDWNSAEDTESIRYELANNAKGSIAQKYIKQFGLKDYQEKADELGRIDKQVQFNRQYLEGKDPMSAQDYGVSSLPFGIGTVIKRLQEKYTGVGDFDVRRKAKQITDAEGTTRTDYSKMVGGFAATLPLQFGIYGKAEQLVTQGVSGLSKTNKIARSINEMRLTSPKLFSIANNSLVEVADYGVRKVVDSEFTSKTDLLMGIGLGGVFGSLFGGKSVKGVVDSFTRKDVVEIEKLLPSGDIRPSDAFDLIKDYKLENGFTISEVQDALKSQGKTKLLKNKTISEDDVLMSLENGLNGSLINRTTAKRIAGVINQAKSDIDNATPNGLFSSGNPTDDAAGELINDIISEFSQAGKVYTTDDAADVINGIVGKYGKKYKLEEGDGDIEDLLFDIRANGNGGKLAEVDSLEGLYKLAGKKSENVKMQEIIDLRKKVEKFEQMSSTKSGAKVKMDKNFGVDIQKLADDANYTSPINIFKKDGAIDVEKAYKVLDDIEAHSFTNSTRFRSVMKNNEDVFMSKIGLKQKTKRGAISSVNTRIKLIDKDRKDAIKLGDDVIKQITLDPNSRLSKSQRTSIYNQMRGQLATANSYADVKAIVKKATQKMWIVEAKSLQKGIDKIFSDSAKKLKGSVTYASYHEDVMSEVIRANEAWKATNDISHLREGIDKVNRILKDGRDAIKEFDESRKLVVDTNVKNIVEEAGGKRIEFGYEEGLYGKPEEATQKINKSWTEADYPIRKIPELFGENSTGKKVFFDNLANAQSLYFKESDAILEKSYQLVKAFDGKGEQFNYKYSVYKLYRRILTETGDSQYAKNFLLDSSNLRLKDGKFFFSDNAKTDLPQISQVELERVLMDVDNLLKSDGALIKLDKFLDEFYSSTGNRLGKVFEEEYDISFPGVADYYKIKYKGGMRGDVEENVNGISIFNQPIAALGKGFSNKFEGFSGEYALELDPLVLLNDVVRNQLRFVYFKKPLGEAVRTLNKLGGLDVSGSNKLDTDGYDELFKAFGLAEDTRDRQASRIADGAYTYIRNYLTDVANAGQKKDYLDTALGKYIYSNFLSWNTSPVISQWQSYVYMIPNGADNLYIAGKNLSNNIDYIEEISGYFSMRRETILGGKEVALGDSFLGNIKERFVKGFTETSNKWKYDKKYAGLAGKYWLWQDVGFTPMKAMDGVISGNAWLQEAVRWSKQNGFYTSGKFDLRAIVEKLSPEQLDNLRVSADSYMNNIMGASDEVSGKVFASGLAKSFLILGKTNFNAVMNTFSKIKAQKTIKGKAGLMLTYMMLNGLITYGLEGIKAEAGYRAGLRSTNNRFDGWIVNAMKAFGVEIDESDKMGLNILSSSIQALIPLGGGGFTLNEIFGVGESAINKVKTGYEASTARGVDATIKQLYSTVFGRGTGNGMLGQVQSRIFFGTDSATVANQNYALSKTDLDISNMSRAKIEELVGLKNDMDADYKAGKSESAIKSSAKDELSSRILKEFDEVPSTQQFMQFVQNSDNKPLLIQAGLTDNVAGLKSFHNDLKLEKAKSEGEVVSILGSADTEFIFNRRLKQYYDSGDTAGYQKEMKFLMDNGVIKNAQGFNNWMNKNVIQNTKYKKGEELK